MRMERASMSKSMVYKIEEGHIRVSARHSRLIS